MSNLASPSPSRVDDKVTPSANGNSIATATATAQAPSTSTSAAPSAAPSAPPSATVLATSNVGATANGLVQNNIKSTTVLAPRPRLKSGHSTPNMNGPLYMQTSGNGVVLVRRLRRKDEGTWKHLSRWFVENQVGTSSAAPNNHFPFRLPVLSSFHYLSAVPSPPPSPSRTSISRSIFVGYVNEKGLMHESRCG
ncbi:hypothetical protein BGZ63DRAFT_37761 [Mariannaea sp. PMI_226]|nr:hypothetical protein BGZ63DRAFT_37761 [Mariannaea sp. PMI_226]